MPLDTSALVLASESFVLDLEFDLDLDNDLNLYLDPHVDRDPSLAITDDLHCSDWLG